MLYYSQMDSSLQKQEKHGTYLPQTDKYVGKLSDREYVTVSDPELTIPHFNSFVPSSAYAEALSGKVIQCVDIMVYSPDTNEVLIGRRDQEPHAGDWVIGGGMKAGETVAQAAARNMQRELGEDINKDLLQEVGDYKFVWDTRAQDPTVNQSGDEVTSCHMSSTLEMYPVNKDSLDISSFNEEYDELKWVNVLDILNAPEGTYHPCLVDMVTDMLEVETAPNKPSTADEAILRHTGAIAYIKANGLPDQSNQS
jgi:ADP-ribose pyrophosphatase YjhB (NUDIX family)